MDLIVHLELVSPIPAYPFHYSLILCLINCHARFSTQEDDAGDQPRWPYEFWQMDAGRRHHLS
uniref:Uncharacterized protein n=1 Tax=Nelumbo nucifera TaxID=4432 RepID=A0A822Y0H3_NELNU|nr:TPA_asm: hypothetical protein HUJ06_027568 [Nelumbo nucifera]